MPLSDTIRESQIWKSIFRHPMPVDRRNRIVVMLTNFFLHLHPVSIKKQGIALSYTWCMGGVTFFLFLVETITGVLLMFYYRPTLEWAFKDIQDLRDVVSLGVFRELHRWGAHAMVITTWLHMLRVFMTGSYKPPREFNWCVGVILLKFTLLLSFTGYLLPDDQLGMWAVTVGTNMARATPIVGHEGPLGPQIGANAFNDVRFALIGGSIVDANAILRAYIWHCLGIPIVLSIFLVVHFWRIRKDGNISGPAPFKLRTDAEKAKPKQTMVKLVHEANAEVYEGK